MASARSGELPLSSNDDIAAEIMCQELITGRGFHYNEEALIADYRGVYSPDVLLAKAEEFSMLVKKAGDEFRKNARGKMICIRV